MIAGVWEVQGRWLTDLLRFNEFMNEEDFEVDDDVKIGVKQLRFHRYLLCAIITLPLGVANHRVPTNRRAKIQVY